VAPRDVALFVGRILRVGFGLVVFVGRILFIGSGLWVVVGRIGRFDGLIFCVQLTSSPQVSAYLACITGIASSPELIFTCA
jgi:hypothetical protein